MTMASSRVKPMLNVPSTGKVIRKAARPKSLNQGTGPILSRLTVVWVQTNGVPFNTTGFFARLFRKTNLLPWLPLIASESFGSTISVR